MYAVTAVIVTTTPDAYKTTRQVPTFFLDENVQGIVSERHAWSIAHDILIATMNPADMHTTTLSIDVARVS